MNPENTSSRALLIVLGAAVIIVAAGAVWYMTRSGGDGYDFPTATTTRPGQNDGLTPSGESENIVVYMPRVNERVGTPLVIQGQARVFENTVNFRLLDASGKEIAEGFATADSPDVGQFGSFRGELNFISETDQKGTLEVYWLSPQDGSETDKLTVPVVITKTAEFIKG
jgi:hypothetical protein